MQYQLCWWTCARLGVVCLAVGLITGNSGEARAADALVAPAFDYSEGARSNHHIYVKFTQGPGKIISYSLPAAYNHCLPLNTLSAGDVASSLCKAQQLYSMGQQCQIFFQAIAGDPNCILGVTTQDGTALETRFFWSNVGIGTDEIYEITPDAQYVSMSVPSVMIQGQTYNVSVQFKNTGRLVWSPSSWVRLGSQAPRDNTTWGFGRLAVANTVQPGQTYTFAFKAKAPTTPGQYDFQWGMVWDQVTWFGALTPKTTVTVNAAPMPALSVVLPQNPLKVAGFPSFTAQVSNNLSGLRSVNFHLVSGTVDKIAATATLSADSIAAVQARTPIFDSKAFANGSYTLYAEGTDNLGRKVKSPNYSLVVTNLYPKLFGIGEPIQDFTIQRKNIYPDFAFTTEQVFRMIDTVHASRLREWLHLDRLFQPSSTVMNESVWAEYRKVFQLAQARNVDILLISHPVSPASRDLSLRKAQIDLFASRYEAIAKRLQAEGIKNVKYFEPGNENNSDTFLSALESAMDPLCAKQYGSAASFLCSSQQFSPEDKARITLETLFEVSRRVKAVDPSFKIVFPGLFGIDGDLASSTLQSYPFIKSTKGFLVDTYKLIAEGSLGSTNPRDFFDVMAWHPYTWSYGTFVQRNLEIFSVMKANNDGNVPIIFTEAGASDTVYTKDVDSCRQVWTDQTVAGILQNLIFKNTVTLNGQIKALQPTAAGVETILYFRLADAVKPMPLPTFPDCDRMPENMGFYTSYGEHGYGIFDFLEDGSFALKPSGQAYQRISENPLLLQ